MVTREKFLIVVSILEGRKFPKRSRHQLLIETRFDGEHLATDPVAHTETPELCTELAWEVSKKALHQHRLQRTPIKLVCYALVPATNAKENVGYVMLDLRTAIMQEASPAKVPVTSKWYPLLNTKYNRHKPQLKVGVSLEADTQAKEDSFRAKAAPPRRAPGMPDDDSSDAEIDPSSLKPILNDTNGFYQIGPADQCTESFVLSVTIAYAANLAQLVPSNIPLPSRDKGFFFYYSLFGNDVTNEPFHDLLNASFPAERASVRLRSSVAALRMMLAREPALTVHLCCGEQSLGSAEIPLNSLLRPHSDAINKQPLILEGSFRLAPPPLSQPAIPPGDGSSTACVGVSVALRREEIPLQPVLPKVPSSQPTSAPSRIPPPTPPHVTPPKPPGDGQGRPPQQPAKEGPKCLNSPAGGSQDSYTEPTDTSRTDADAGSIPEEEVKRGDRKVDSRQPTATTNMHPVPEPTAQPPTQPVRDDASISTSQPHVMIDAPAHHFSISIDLRSIKNVETTTNLNIYLRYLYPFFGSVSPILTHPPIEVRRHTEVLLPHSYCSFNLAATVQQLQETLLRVPLLVEVWHRDRMTKDQLLGVARVPLAGVLRAEKARTATPSSGGAEGTRQIHSERVTAETASDGQPTRLAEMHVVLGLEDYGPIRAQQVFMGSEMTSSSSMAPPPQHRQAPPPAPPLAQQAPPPDPRETAEYKAALELEMWKEQYVRDFENQLKEKELQHLKSLTEEWKRKDREREALIEKKLKEHTHLETQLRSAFADIEKRERQLAANEAEVMRLRGDMQREQERQMTEMREVSRRIKEDHIAQSEIEKSKVRLLEEEKHHLSQLLSQAQAQLQEKDREFQAYKDQIATKPEVRLQSDLSLLKLEKVELERKLESVTKSKVHYKQQWGRALKELARLKQREQTEAKARLKREQQELEHMRLRYLAAEEKEVVKSERQQLDEIKGELNRLKQQELDKEQIAQHRQTSPAQPPAPQPQEHKENVQPPGVGTMDPGVEAHVARLIEERDTLLRTGVYTHQDRIISELDRQIRESIARGQAV